MKSMSILLTRFHSNTGVCSKSTVLLNCSRTQGGALSQSGAQTVLLKCSRTQGGAQTVLLKCSRTQDVHKLCCSSAQGHRACTNCAVCPPFIHLGLEKLHPFKLGNFRNNSTHSSWASLKNLSLKLGKLGKASFT